PLLLPAGTVNCEGRDATATDPLTIAKVTTVLLASARANVTLPSELLPPVTVDGVKVTEVGVFGFRVRLPVLLPPFAVALTCTVVATGTFLVTVLHVLLLLVGYPKFNLLTYTILCVRLYTWRPIWLWMTS